MQFGRGLFNFGSVWVTTIYNHECLFLGATMADTNTGFLDSGTSQDFEEKALTHGILWNSFFKRRVLSYNGHAKKVVPVCQWQALFWERRHFASWHVTFLHPTNSQTLIADGKWLSDVTETLTWSPYLTISDLGYAENCIWEHTCTPNMHCGQESCVYSEPIIICFLKSWCLHACIQPIESFVLSSESLHFALANIRHEHTNAARFKVVVVCVLFVIRQKNKLHFMGVKNKLLCWEA